MGGPEPREPGDADLLARVARGDEAAFAELYRRHGEWVHRLARRFVDAEQARDVTQEAFLHLVEAAGRLRLSGRLTTYLYPVVKNLCLAVKRRDRRLRIGEPPADAALSISAPDPGGNAALLDALSRLPDGQREVLLMRVVDGMAVEEVAAALGLPAGTVKSRLHAALAALREDPRLRDLMGD